VKRDAHAIILLLVGGALIRTTITGGYAAYVRVGMYSFLLATGLILVAVATASLIEGVLARRHTAEQSGHAHEHGHGFDAGWVLVVPLLALLLLAPPAVGSYTAGRAGTALGTQSPVSEFPALPDGDPVRLAVLDYANRAVFDDGRSLGQRRVAVTGFVLPGRKGKVYLARMVISCCAADARPIKVGLTGQVPADLPADEWITATGRYTDQHDTDEVNDETIPYLVVESVVTVPVPKQPYES
jgi:uncharacterized repeat protein (TIGR03943 family)